MSIFPKISLRLEVENYLKAGFMNKEVGQIKMLDDICKKSDIYTLERKRETCKRKPNLYSCCFLLINILSVKNASIFPQVFSECFPR